MAHKSCNGYREGFEFPERDKNEIKVCDTCDFESDNIWKRNEHFEKTGHAHFTPKRLLEVTEVR